MVRSVIGAKDTAELSSHGIGAPDVFDEARTSFEWMEEYVRKESKWPTAHMVEENLGVELPEEAEDLGYICDLVRKRKLAQYLEQKLRRAAELLESRDPDEALALTAGISLEAPAPKTAGVESYRACGTSRIEVYDNVRDHPELVGVTTPWPTLDAAIQCWVNGEFSVITAMQNMGKSWVLCVTADHALVAGKKVLLVSMEMSGKKIQRRLDAIRYRIPFKQIRNASMPDEIEEFWKERVRSDLIGTGDILVADKTRVKHVSDVVALVREHKPELVLIDGGYRFAPKPTGKSGSQWAGTVEIVTDLQIAAEVTNIPWVVTTQQGDSNETGKTKRGSGPKMSAWNVRYGKEWVINPDVVIGLYQDEDMRMTKIMDIFVLKMREATGDDLGEFKINWDHTAMRFAELARPKAVVLSETGHEVEF